jgi:hypothetical protein
MGFEGSSRKRLDNWEVLLGLGVKVDSESVRVIIGTNAVCFSRGNPEKKGGVPTERDVATETAFGGKTLVLSVLERCSKPGVLNERCFGCAYNVRLNNPLH